MLPGPVFVAELITSARRGRYYLLRVIYLLILFFVIWTNYQSAVRWVYSLGMESGRFELTIEEMANFASATFYSFVVLQAIAVLGLTPALVAGGIASEKQRKTLHYLLASRLTSAEIVLGKLFARLLHVGVFIALGLPVISLLSLFGGVDPVEIGLAYAATVSTALFLAALGILFSTLVGKARDAIALTYLVMLVWLFVPLIIATTMPLAWPQLYGYVAPVNDWIFASSPMVLFYTWARTVGAGPSVLVEAVGWMIGLQLAVGLGLVGLAVARLRPTFRSQEGGTSWLRRFLRSGRPAGRLLPRPALGDDADPMLWKERYVSRTRGLTRVVTRVIGLVLGGLLAYQTYRFAVPAFAESYGLSSAGRGGFFSAREEFTFFLQSVVTLIYIVWLCGVAGSAAASVSSEREEDTWTSLIATPLSGREILRAKLIGALWRPRWLAYTMLGLGALGVAAGSVHLLGFLGFVIALNAYTAFAASLGLLLSLRLSSTTKAQAVTFGILLFVNVGYLLFIVCLGPETPIFLVPCSPAIVAGTFFPQDVAQIQSQDGQWITVWFISVGFYAVAAAVLMIEAFGGFSLAVDRPRRPVGIPSWGDRFSAELADAIDGPDEAAKGWDGSKSVEANAPGSPDRAGESGGEAQ